MPRRKRLKPLPEHPLIPAVRLAIDALLRKRGFCLLRRPKQGEPIWQRAGILYRQSAAVLTLDPHDVEDAAYLETLRAEGYE